MNYDFIGIILMTKFCSVDKHHRAYLHFFNGNGRHSRLMADIIISHIYGKPVFPWGRSDLSQNGEARKRYLKAIYMADEGSYSDLIKFGLSGTKI